MSNAQPADFTWTIGGFYQKAKLNISDIQQVPDSGFKVANKNQLSNNKDLSLFGQLGYQVTPTFDVSVGARYTWFSRNDNIIFPDLDEVNQPPLSNEKSTSFNPQVTLTYKPDSKHTYYARVAKGYRAPNASASSTETCVVPKLKPDQTLNYEVGTKLSLGGVVNINAAAYYIDWKDIAVSAVAPGCLASEIFPVNAGNAKSYGIEAELVARISDALTLNTSVTLSKAKLGKVPVGFTSGFEGEQLPGSASLRISGGLSYSKPISDTAKIFADISAIYVGPFKSFLRGDFSNTFKNSFPGASVDGVIIIDPDLPLREPSVGDYATVNLRLGVDFDKWSASIYANNVLNSRATSSIAFPLEQAVPTEAPFVPVKPRTIGLDVSVKF